MSQSAELRARISKQFPASAASPAFALEVEFNARPGITVLFGVSGAGKSLTLGCISGFVRPDSGRILLDDRILYDSSSNLHIPPRDRGCGYVFQNYALFPHMTLRENLAFAAEGRPRLERHRFVNDMLERFHISEFSGRYPHEVSGGQKQRCSIARTLVANPKLLLLDEPARGLDAALRQDFYAILRDLRADWPLPIILVTHDLEECFATADTLLIVGNGKILQSGEPRKVLDRPANKEIAGILGFENIFEAEILALDPGRNTSRFRAFSHELAGCYFPGRFIGDRIHLCAQASALRIQQNPGQNRIPAKLLRMNERTQTLRAEFFPGLVVDFPLGDAPQDLKSCFVELPAESLKPC